jgi:hypothetical protein
MQLALADRSVRFRKLVVPLCLLNENPYLLLFRLLAGFPDVRLKLGLTKRRVDNTFSKSNAFVIVRKETTPHLRMCYREVTPVRCEIGGLVCFVSDKPVRSVLLTTVNSKVDLLASLDIS